MNQKHPVIQTTRSRVLQHTTIRHITLLCDELDVFVKVRVSCYQSLTGSVQLNLVEFTQLGVTTVVLIASIGLVRLSYLTTLCQRTLLDSNDSDVTSRTHHHFLETIGTSHLTALNEQLSLIPWIRPQSRVILGRYSRLQIFFTDFSPLPVVIYIDILPTSPLVYVDRKLRT